MGRFDERATSPARGPRDMLRWRILDTIAGRRVKDPGGFVTPRRENDGAALALAAPSLTWIGHATFVMRLGGALIATDPIWSERVGGVVKRKTAPGVALEKVPPLDIVTVSHNHFDHLDLPTLKRLGKQALYVTPLGNGELLSRLGYERVVELDWWQSHREGEVEITLVPSRHWSMRAPWNRNDALWGGFVYKTREGTAYHSGDTALFEGFREIGERCGPIDWAMLPIGAYEPRWFMEPQHCNPEDAGEAFLRLGARNLVAMHWGTFRLTDEPMGEPPERMRAFFRARGLDESRLWILDVGETRALGR
ncbi:MAG TPA: MBL fold metallo-hydrolase [Polyangia bacterium]|nr:MBL fold metallo-hydrolase [Polyangia bacterium]